MAHGWTRRRFVRAAAAGSAVISGGVLGLGLTRREATGIDAVTRVERMQWGVANPAVPLPFLELVVLDVDGSTGGIRSRLDDLGRAILEVGDDPGDGSVTAVVGVGGSVVAHVGDPSGASPSLDLPHFASDSAIAERARDGDVCIQVCAADADDAAATARHLASSAPGLSVRWRQSGFRGPASGSVTANPLGFADGISVPGTDDQLAEHVAMDGGPHRAGATVMVIRRIELDTRAFRALTVDQQERVIGRRRDGSPLSGGGPTAGVDLHTKTADGRLLIPSDAHVRAAHPSATGSHLMLRRSYSYEDERSEGLVFISFQRDLRTFVATQHRIDEVDALAAFMTPTASAAFVVPPAFSAERPLGQVVSSLTSGPR